MGGPTICPSCDCGNFGLPVVQRQGARIRDLEADVARLTRERGQIEDRVKHAEYEAARWREALSRCAETVGQDTAHIGLYIDIHQAIARERDRAEKAERAELERIRAALVARQEAGAGPGYTGHVQIGFRAGLQAAIEEVERAMAVAVTEGSHGEPSGGVVALDDADFARAETCLKESRRPSEGNLRGAAFLRDAYKDQVGLAGRAGGKEGERDD